MHIWTDTPQTELWQQLRYFKWPTNVSQLLSGKTKSRRPEAWISEVSDRAGKEIAACVEQADEYMHASRVVGLATRPLLQFYSVESLAKAMILSNDRSVTLDDLRYHGLSTRPNSANERVRDELKHYSESADQWSLENEFAIANQGVFPELATATGDAQINIGAVLRLRELLRIIPDLSELYQRHYGDISNCVRIYTRSEETDERFEAFFDVADASSVTSVFPEFNVGFESADRHSYPGFRATSDIGNPPNFARLVRHTVAGEFMVRPHASGVSSSPAVLFASSFIVGNLVRYKPAFWMSILQGSDTGAAAIVETLCNLVDRRFAQDVLEALWGERFSFGAPGYLA
jgi:hypothetical protein